MSTDEKKPAATAASGSQSAGPQGLLMAGVVIVLLAIGAVIWLIATGTGTSVGGGNNSAEAAAPAAPAARGPTPGSPTPGGGQQLPSGLRLETVREGRGPLVTPGDTVAFRYELRTVGGPVIESNLNAPQAAIMPVAGLVPGFQEGLTHMRAGGEARFWIPPYLGYGDSPPGEGIGPNDTLEFRVRLERIVPAGSASPAATAPTANSVDELPPEVRAAIEAQLRNGAQAQGQR